MKKLFLYLLCFIFIITFSGVTVNMHYCMGKAVGTSFNLLSNSTKKCGDCGMEKSNKKSKGCCHDSNKLVKVIEDQKLTVVSFSFDHTVFRVAALKSIEYKVVGDLKNAILSKQFHDPPLYSGVPIFIKDCSFLI